MTTVCDGPKRLKISWTALQTHEECKQKAYLFREKHKTPGGNIRPFFHGIVADRICRAWLDSDDPQPGEMVSWVEDFIDSCRKEAKETGDGIVKWKDSNDRAEMTVWLKELLRRLEPFLIRDVLPYLYEPEFKFRVPIRIPDLAGNLSEIDLVGGMDILVREVPLEVNPGIWAGYDLKATENPDYIRKTLGQGIFYALAHFARTGERFRTFAFLLPMVDSNPIVNVNITDQDLAVLLSRITKMCHDIWRNDVSPKKDMQGCAWCNVKHACSKMQGTGEKTTFAPKPKR